MKKLLSWLAGLTLMMRCFVIALMLHLAILFVVGSYKVMSIIPKPTGILDGSWGGGLSEQVQERDSKPVRPEDDYLSSIVKGTSPLSPDRNPMTPDFSPTPNGGGGGLIVVLTDSLAAGHGFQPTALNFGNVSGPSGNGVGRFGSPTGTSDGIAEIRQRLIESHKRQPGPGGSARGGGDTLVLAALRYLKANQNTDGSWDGPKSVPASTALAVLAFLGHNETPESKEFGDNVSRGIQYLVGSISGNGQVNGGSMYAQGAVTLALAEAYSMTRAKVVREALESSVKFILAAQAVTKPEHQQGGWRYSATSVDSDVSVSGWMIMGLKSAKLAGIEVPDRAFAEASKYLWNCYWSDNDHGGFGYNGPGQVPSMTGVGVLCQQFLGQGQDKRIQKALTFLQTQKLDWSKGTANGRWTIYGWYYITQAMFHAGGKYWAYWDSHFAKAISSAQQPDGSWDPPTGSGEAEFGKIYNTALTTLMLEVYYRYLPIYKQAKPA